MRLNWLLNCCRHVVRCEYLNKSSKIDTVFHVLFIYIHALKCENSLHLGQNMHKTKCSKNVVPLYIRMHIVSK